MAGEPAAASGETLGANLQKALVSMVRLSSAFALYGVVQLQTAFSFQQGKGFPRAWDDWEAVLDAMTVSLEEHLNSSDREAVKSATKLAGQVVRQSVESLGLMDPRRVLRAANELVQKSTEVMSSWSGGAKPNTEDKPELAVEVLGSSGQ